MISGVLYTHVEGFRLEDSYCYTLLSVCSQCFDKQLANIIADLGISSCNRSTLSAVFIDSHIRIKQPLTSDDLSQWDKLNSAVKAVEHATVSSQTELASPSMSLCSPGQRGPFSFGHSCSFLWWSFIRCLIFSINWRQTCQSGGRKIFSHCKSKCFNITVS